MDKKNGLSWTQLPFYLPKRDGDKEGERKEAEQFLLYDMAFWEWVEGVLKDQDCILFRQFIHFEFGESDPAKYRAIPSYKLPINAELQWDDIERLV